MTEQESERDLIDKLADLKYTYRPDIRDRISLEKNFRQKFEELNPVHLTDSEFSRLLELIIVPDVFTAARALRERNSFERDDGTPCSLAVAALGLDPEMGVLHMDTINRDSFACDLMEPNRSDVDAYVLNRIHSSL